MTVYELNNSGLKYKMQDCLNFKEKFLKSINKVNVLANFCQKYTNTKESKTRIRILINILRAEYK